MLAGIQNFSKNNSRVLITVNCNQLNTVKFSLHTSAKKFCHTIKIELLPYVSVLIGFKEHNLLTQLAFELEWSIDFFFNVN